MAIAKEYICPGHGPFESDRPICPSGCTVAEREFRTPPAFHNGTTSKTDDLIRSQVEAFGLSNIRSAREGETSRIPSAGEKKQAEFQKAIRQKYPSNWGAIAPGGTMNVRTGAVEKSDRGPGAAATIAQHGAEPANVIEQTGLKGAKPAYQAVQDKQGLKVDISKAA